MKNRININSSLSIYILFTFSPVIFLILRNPYYKLNYFIFPIIFSFAISFLIFLLLFFFFKERILLDKVLIGISSFWYIQFYFNDLSNHLNLDWGKDYLIKTIILLLFILISYLLATFYSKKIFKFIIIYFSINYLLLFYYLLPFSLSLSGTIYKTNKIAINPSTEFNSSKSKEENVYYIIADSLSSVNYIKKNINIDSSTYIKDLESNGFFISTGSRSSYDSTVYTLGSIFHQDYYKEGIYRNRDITAFPKILSKGLQVELFNNLNGYGYKFWHVGNVFISCEENKFVKCIKSKKTVLEKFFTDPAFNKFIQEAIIRKPYYVSIKTYTKLFNKRYNETEIDTMIDFIDNNHEIIQKKKNFFFIHHMNPHAPYRDSDCNISLSSDLKSLKKSHICAFKKISEISNKIIQIDPNAIIIFQGDHGVNINAIKNEIFPIFNALRVPSVCRKKLTNNMGNVETINLVMSCIGYLEIGKFSPKSFNTISINRKNTEIRKAF